MIHLARTLESSLLPFPDTMSWEKGNIVRTEWSAAQKIRYRAEQTFNFLASIALFPVALAMSLGSRMIGLFHGVAPQIKKADSPADLSSALPADFGFADSLFQTSGLGTWASATELKGRSNWNQWLKPEHIEGPNTYPECFVDILKNPRPFIQILKNMNVTAHRFSLEWAVIEPMRGQLDLEAIDLYRNFIKELKKEGIEPYVTLHHFVLPEWFGDFEQLENVDLFVSHSLKMMDLFPEVKNWMTINEPGVYALQTRIRRVYPHPPSKRNDLDSAAQVLRNLLIAHCKIYKDAKEKFGDKVQVGITHQWLNFEPLEGNPLEKMICYFMSKIIHYAAYNFFKTGRFDFDIPLKTNVHLNIPEKEFEKNNRFLDFIGVQFYGYPRLKAGFNGAREYPGHGTINIPLLFTGLTFGSTCPKGGKVMSFGPSFYPESLQDCLTEAAALNKPIAITETGCDARIQKWGDKEFTIDNETQKEYFVKIAPILHRFKHQMKAFFTWTLCRGHLEWDRGAFPALGTMELMKDRSRKITGCKLYPAAELLQKVYGERKFTKQAA